MANKGSAQQFDGTCFCLIELVAKSHCEATIYLRGSGQKAFHLYDSKTFSSSGVASKWAYSIAPDIEIVKVQNYVWE